jgi:hypothetical protein
MHKCISVKYGFFKISFPVFIMTKDGHAYLSKVIKWSKNSKDSVP